MAARDGAPHSKKRRTLPPSSEVADPEAHVFIPLEKSAAEIDNLFSEGNTIVFIRGGVATGKSTLAAYLARQHKNKYVKVACTDEGREDAWKLGTVEAVRDATGKEVCDSQGLGFRSALRLAKDMGLTLIYDEAHTIFASTSLCFSLFKGDAAFRPNALLFSAAGEAAASGTAAATPTEISQKFMWMPPMPNASELKEQLTSAGVKLDVESVDFFLKFCAGHYGIFMAAMRWVQKLQGHGSAEWSLGDTVRKVRRSYGNGDWSEGSILDAVAESRAVRVNGLFQSLEAIPDSFVQLLCGGPMDLCDEWRKVLTIHGFVLPHSAEDISEVEFLRMSWSSPNVTYKVANPLLAEYYRHFLRWKRGMRVGLKASAAPPVPPKSCADLLLRAVPYLSFSKVTGYEVDDRSALSATLQLPHEDQYNGAFRAVLASLGYQPVSPQSSAPGQGKPDCIVDCGAIFVMEGVMAGSTIDEHRQRFDNQDRYRRAAHKALYIIGNDVNDMRKKVKAVRTDGIEIIGLVPNRAHSHYTVLVRTENAEAGSSPFEFGIDCDLVARSFKVNDDGSPDIQCVQILEHINPPQGAASSSASTVKVQLDLALEVQKAAVAGLKFAVEDWATARHGGNEEEIKQAEEKVAKAKQEVAKAKQEVKEAKQEVKEAEAKVEEIAAKQ